MSRNTHLLLGLSALFITLNGCDQGGGDTTASNDVGPTRATIPAAFFTTERPTEVADLIQIKPTAAVGDSVTFLARVGGRVEPFVDGLAIFTVADPSLLSCELMGEEDHCPLPWDYCCEPPNGITAGSATIRLAGNSGDPIAANAEGAGGLEPLKFVVVEGVVNERNDEGLFVIDATQIWVGGKPTRGNLRRGSLAGEENEGASTGDNDAGTHASDHDAGVPHDHDGDGKSDH
jgi:hypothetical protein